MRKNEDDLQWVLEGVTAQYAGELMFDVPETRLIRSQCRHSYLACLEDWLFSIIYADNIAIAQPGKVGNHNPGSDLIGFFRDFVTITLPAAERKPEELLNDDDLRGVIRGDMDRLSKSIAGGSLYWRQWITREAEAFFGIDRSIFQNRDPGQYIFRKRPALMYDDDLAKSIPVTAISFLQDTVSQHLSGKRAPSPHPAAIRDFVIRNMLTLVTISRWYDMAASKDAGIRLPSPVRSLVYQSASVGGLHSQLQEVQIISLRNALGRILEKRPACRPEELMRRAYDLRDDPKIVRTRRLLSDLFRELHVANSTHVEQLGRDLSRLAERDGKTSDTVGQTRVERDWVPVVKRTIRRAERILGAHTPSYLESVERVFPELFGSPPLQTSIGVLNMNHAGRDVNVVTGTAVNVGGEGNVGSIVHNISSTPVAHGLNEVKEALDGLLYEMQQHRGSDPEHAVAIASITAARDSAEKGDENKIFEYLKRAGTWALAVAEKVGIPVAIDLLKRAAHLA